MTGSFCRKWKYLFYPLCVRFIFFIEIDIHNSLETFNDIWTPSLTLFNSPRHLPATGPYSEDRRLWFGHRQNKVERWSRLWTTFRIHSVDGNYTLFLRKCDRFKAGCHSKLCDQLEWDFVTLRHSLVKNVKKQAISLHDLILIENFQTYLVSSIIEFLLYVSISVSIGCRLR